MAQNQPKLTADWFAHRMSATHTPAAPASKKGPMQELKDQRALGGKDSYQSNSAWQQIVPTSPWYSPSYQSSWGRGPAHSPPPHAGWGGGAHTARLPSPGFQPGHYTPLTEGRGAGRSRARGAVGVRIGEGAAVAAARCVHSAPTRASPPTTPSQRALSPRATSAAHPDTSSATAPTRINRQTTAAVPEWKEGPD